MHISSLQVWLGVNNSSNDSLGPVLPQYSFIEKLYPSSNDTNFLAVPVTDASNNIYHRILRQSDGKVTILKTDSSGVIQWQYLLTGSTYFEGAMAISSTNKMWTQIGTTTLAVMSPRGAIKSQTNFLSLGDRGNISRIKLDSSGNVYLLAFNQLPNNYVVLHMYKLDSNGVWQWGSEVNLTAAMGSWAGSGLEVDSSGNAYVTSTINYYDSPTSSYYYTSVIFKWNASGVLQWQKRYTTVNREVHFGATGIDSSGNLYIKGGFPHNTLSSYPQALTKVDSSGTVVWTKAIEWPPTGQSFVGQVDWNDVVTDSSGNSYIFFGPSIPPLTMSEEIYGSETLSLTYYLMKYNSSGVLQWQRQLAVQGVPSSNSGSFPNPYMDFDSTKTYLILRVPNFEVVSVGYAPYKNNWLMIKVPVDGSKMGSYNFNGKTIVYGSGSLSELATIPLNVPAADSWAVTAVTQSTTTGSITTSSVDFAATVLILDYGVAPATNSVTEGGTLTFTVTTNNVSNGTTLYYNLSSLSTAVAADFTSYSGSFTVNNNTGTFNVTLAVDAAVESDSFYMDVKTGSINGTIVGTSQLVSITDSSPTYVVTPQSTSVYESASLNFTVTATSVADGTVLYFGLNAASTASTTDFSAYSGTCTITSGTSSFSVTVTRNDPVENEYFYIDLRTDSAVGTIVATSSQITIIDTVPTYSITPSATTMVVGNGNSFNIATTYVPNGTVLTYNLYTGSSSNFSSYSGSVTINNNIGSFTVTTLSTAGTDVPYTFSMALINGGVTVATSSIVTVNGVPGTVTWKRLRYSSENFVLSVGFVAASSTHAVIGQVSSGIDQVHVLNLSTGVNTKLTLPNGTGNLIPSRGWYEQGKFTVIATYTMDRRATIWQCSGDPAVANNWTATTHATFFPAEYGFVNKGAWTFINNTYVMLVGTGSSPNGANEYIYYSSDGVNWSKSTVATTKATADNASSLSMANNGSAILYHSRNLSGKIYYYNNNTFTTSSAFTQTTPTTVVGAGYSIAWSKEAGWIIAPTNASAIRSTSLTTLSPATTISVTGGASRVFATKPGASETTRVIITPYSNSEVLTYSGDGGITWTTTSIPVSNLNGHQIDAGTVTGNTKIYLANGYYCYLYIGTVW